ncbi:LysR substrate-binding domain-containing protein [Leptolyngbya sp. AS-A5]|nr:LysR substrate-binding domain-containing protein [Leptolyngbya sp. FACHB-17]
MTVGNYWLPDRISRFKQQYPGIYIHCILGNAEEIGEGTALGRFDLGLVTGGVKQSCQDHLQQESVGQERLQIAVGQSHPWFGQPTIATHELLTSTWVMRESGSGAQQMFEQALARWHSRLLA